MRKRRKVCGDCGRAIRPDERFVSSLSREVDPAPGEAQMVEVHVRHATCPGPRRLPAFLSRMVAK